MPEITMPQLGETVTEGTITRWLKQVGDRVEEDEVIYEVSTDKVDSEVPSPVAGFLTEIRVAEGETAEVGAVLAVVGEAPPASGGEPAPDAEAAAPADDTGTDEGADDEPGASEVQEAAAIDPPAAEAAPGGQGNGRSDGQSSWTGPERPAEPTSAPADEPQAEPQPELGDGGREGAGRAGGSILSPVVRRLVAEHGLDPASIPATGAGGRITRGDVLAFIDQGTPGSEQSATTDEPAPSAPARSEAPPSRGQPPRPPAAAEAVRAGEGDEIIPFSNIRRRTAEHMVRSLATSAHTLVVIEVDYENVDQVRHARKERFKEEEGVSLTYLPFVARATVDAIRDFPYVNASVGDEELIVHRNVNLGIAVDLDFQGLIVPVVKEADSKRLRALAREIGGLGRRAKAKKLSADEISGGTFTITNAGGYGTLITGPIINQPQVTILSTDGVKPRPVAVPLPAGGHGITVHPVGNLAIAFDHRAYDGAYASAFLARLKEILETRDWAAELA